jgi:hypothetical protein
MATQKPLKPEVCGRLSIARSQHQLSLQTMRGIRTRAEQITFQEQQEATNEEEDNFGQTWHMSH